MPESLAYKLIRWLIDSLLSEEEKQELAVELYYEPPDIEVVEVDWNTLFNHVHSVLGLNPRDIWLWDAKYRVPRLGSIEKIVKWDWTNVKSYIREYFDCDDFARVFKAHMLEYYMVNSVALAIGEVRDKNTNRLLGYHAWNYITVINGDGKLVTLLFEPQTDMYTSGDIIGGWKYKPLLVIY